MSKTWNISPMADYPAVPSFAAPLGQTGRNAPLQYAPAQRSEYTYDMSSHATNASAFEHNGNGRGGFGHNNAGFQAFSPAAVASGVPPLPIYGAAWDPNVQQQSPFWAVQTRTPDSLRSLGTPTAGLGSDHMPFASQTVMPQTSAAASTLPARPQAVEEGELSEGEYEESNAQEIPIPGPRVRHESQYRRNYEPPSYGEARRRQHSPEQRAPPLQTGMFDMSSCH